MSEKLPYEEQLTHAWDELPLPNEDMAWKDMKRRLEEDDDDTVVVPPPRRGCGMGALLIAILFLAGFWFFVRPEKWFIKKDIATAEEIKADSSLKENDKVKIETKVKDKTGAGDSSTSRSGNTSELNEQNKTGPGVIIETTEGGIRNTKKPSKPLTIKQENEIQIQDAKTRRANKKQPVPVKIVTDDKRNDTKPGPEQKIKDEESVSEQKKKVETEKNLSDVNIQQEIDSTIQKIPDERKVNTQVKDSSTVKRPDSIDVKQDTVVQASNPKKEKEKDKRPIFFSAGIGLHQQIPIAGQEWTTYGSLGRKGILTDYIPSINFRMEKQDRWFLQTEFRFGAPQHTKQLTFDQVVRIDTPTQTVNTASSVLKKTFYHQVPLSFNYYVLKNWSVGAGVQWNKFYSAVAEQDLKRRSPGSQTDTLISKSTIKVSNDSSSALTKSWWQGMIQTQFQWKRFSIGARYAFGLQPYIRFTLPGQPLQEEKNSTLQIFLRYELWRSKK